MHEHAAAHRPSPLETLFAERHVYIRSGFDGHYVALSRPLQISVALGVVAAVAWLALASYGAIANYVEMRTQRETLTRLQNAGPAAAAALAEAQTARERAERLAEASRAEASELQGALRLTHARIRQAGEQVQRLEAEREALLEQFAAETGGQAPSGAVAGLRAQLEAATRLIEELSSERAALRSRIEQLLASGSLGVAGLRQVEPAKAGRTGSGPDARELAAQLEALKGADGQAALAGVAEAVAALETDLRAAKGTIQTVQQELGRSDRLSDLNLQLTTAKDRLARLDASLERIKSNQSALRAALAAQSQLPSPPKPR
jgi:DNA repair exonuclease SbcCD ATPase subunit